MDVKPILRYAAAAAIIAIAAMFFDVSAALANRFTLSELSPFTCPSELRPQVDFWKKIFTQYTTKQAVIHDNRYLDIIYSSLDLTDEESQSKKSRIGRLSFEISKYREILLKLDKFKPESMDNVTSDNITSDSLTSEEQRVYDMFKGVYGANKFAEAAERIRAQIGQKDRFQKALARSTQYLDEMERIFKEEGVPVALTRLPFVESAFETSAYSWAKAAGIWQFTDSTGRIFLRMNSIVDERIDPMKSTRAAARLLSENYAQLGTWPLAVTAYNHGAGGMARAVRELSTRDIAEIVKRYSGPSFGFASRNYYAEFLAVLEILDDYRSYVGDIEFMKPVEYEVLHTDRAIRMSTIAAACSLDEVQRLNPELKASVMASKMKLPCDYFLKVPLGTKDLLKSQVIAETPPPTTSTAAVETQKTVSHHKSDKKKVDIHSEKKAAHNTTTTAGATKKPEDTAGKSEKVGQTSGAKNNGKSANEPKKTADNAAKPKDKPSNDRHHTVASGQNLYSIAKIYHISVNDLMRVNSITDPLKVKTGQVLKIPAKS